MSVLVLGATGTHGGAVARGLGAAGIDVAALVRDPASDRARALAQAGAALVQGDLLDQASLERAFAGHQAVYAVTTPFEHGAGEEERQGETIVAAARTVSLPWLIFASVAAAARSGVPHFVSKARIEELVAASGVPWTVVAPSYFYENLLGSRAAIAGGELPIALPHDTPLHQVALRDLGGVVAAVVARRAEHLGVRVEIAGDAPTPAQMAGALGVRYRQVPVEEIRARSADLGAMYDFLAREGYGIDVAAVRGRYPEVPWTTFAEWAASVDWQG
jgi:uncharacterized protein YbjT (DUF2867 family)